jgi:O-methyltransferase
MNFLPSVVPQELIMALIEKASETPDGCFVEVGVYQGGTASYLTNLAELQGREVYLYDTFTGIPFAEEYEKHQPGDFTDTSYESVSAALPYAKVVQGIFPSSAVAMPKVAFAHIDVDQYKSYKDCINFLRPMMVEGGIMWFDDYELEGAKKAVDELLGADNLKSIFVHPNHRFYFVC